MVIATLRGVNLTVNNVKKTVRNILKSTKENYALATVFKGRRGNHAGFTTGKNGSILYGTGDGFSPITPSVVAEMTAIEFIDILQANHPKI